MGDRPVGGQGLVACFKGLCAQVENPPHRKPVALASPKTTGHRKAKSLTGSSIRSRKANKCHRNKCHARSQLLSGLHTRSPQVNALCSEQE